MTRLKSLLMILPFIFAGLGAFVLVGMLTTRGQPTRVPFAYAAGSNPYSADMGVFVMDALNREILFESTELHACPSNVSPDGNWLLYFPSDRDSTTSGNYSTQLVNLSTGEQTNFSLYEMVLARWSPDSTRISFYQRSDRKWYLLDAANGNLQSLGEALTPYWVNQHDIVYSTIDENRVTLHWDTETNREYTLSDGVVSDVSLSSDGNYLTVAWSLENRTNRFERITYLIDVQSGDYERLDLGANLGWQPHSNYLLFSNKDGHFVLYDVVSRQVFEINPSYHPQYYTRILPKWSYDGRYISYGVYFEGGTINSNYSLYVFDTVTGDSGLVANRVDTWTAFHHQWISNSHFVYALASSELPLEIGNLSDIWMYDAATGQSTQLTDTPEQYEMFRCEWQ
jgi:Tol biopolymer transport system component